MDEWAEDQGSQEITDEMNIEHRLEIGQALLYHGLITEQTESKEINEEWVVELTRSFDSMDGASSGAMSKRDAFIFIVGEVKYDEDGFVASIKRMKEANDSRDRLLNGGRLWDKYSQSQNDRSRSPSRGRPSGRDRSRSRRALRREATRLLEERASAAADHALKV